MLKHGGHHRQCKGAISIGNPAQSMKSPSGVHVISRRVLGTLSFLSLCIWRDVGVPSVTLLNTGAKYLTEATYGKKGLYWFTV